MRLCHQQVNSWQPKCMKNWSCISAEEKSCPLAMEVTELKKETLSFLAMENN